MRKLSTLRYLLPLFFLGMSMSLLGQTIFSENIGTPTGTTSIAAYSTGTAPATFQNKGTLTYGSGSAANSADLRATSVSSGYTGASGGGNVFFTSTSGEYGFSIESINAASFTSLALQFGYRKESGTVQAAFSVEYWDGTAWNVLANTSANLFNEATNAAIGWYSSKSLSLPVGAQINGLKIRFVKTGTASIRVDDIKLTGQVATPTTTSISPTSANTGDPAFTLTVNGTNFINGSTITWNGSNRTTTYVSATQLTAAIPATDLSTAGTATVGVTTTGAAAVSNTQTFTINATVGGTVTLTSALPAFGNICTTTTAGPNSFTLDGSGLNGSNISLAALTGFTYSETSGGPYTSTLSFSYTGSSFTGKVIYVEFSPTAVQSYSGNIVLSGGGIASYPVAASGAGVNSTPSVTTGGSSAITATSATVAGSISATGCTAITAYGIEYSTASGFPDGSGTQLAASNLSGGNFSVSLTGLAPNTRYYYKAYATNSGGTSYGIQQAFNATPLPVPMAAQPGLSYTEDFADIANWGSFFTVGIGANHWGGLSAAGAGGIPNGTTLTASTTSFQGATFGSSGGVQKGTDQVPATTSLVLLSTGSPDNTTSAAIDFYMDFTGVNAGTLSFDFNTVFNSTGNRNGSLRVYATTDGVTFTDLTAADVLSFTNNVAFSGSKTNIALPSFFNLSPTARLRFYYYNGEGNTGSGSRPKISIDNLTVTALATTPCVTPTAAATDLTFGTITDVSIQGSFTASSPATDNYMVVMSTSSSLTGNPVDGQYYAVGSSVGDGTVISNGAATSFTATALSATTTYYFFVFPVNAVCTGGPLYYTTTVLNGSSATVAGLPSCTAPAAQPTNMTFGTIGTNSIQGSFTGTTADGYLVLRSTSASLTNTPVNGQTYNTGDALGNAIVVQRSSATSFTANSLAPNTPYYFYVFSLNDQGCVNGPAYNTASPLNGTQTTMPLPPCASPGAQPISLALTASNKAISGTFNATGTGADTYLVIASTSAILGASPSDNTDYNVGDVFGNGVVVANTTTSNFLDTGLVSNQAYYFFIFSENKNCSGGTKYISASPLTGNATTTNTAPNNYYFGTLHSHSDYSDGNKDHPGYTPALDYDYAMTAECMDYLGISEHNHFSSPDNPGNSINTFPLGFQQADSFTTAHPNFLAMYGMEWGVISNGGHVVIYGNGMNDLFGWESGSGGWGPTNNYNVYVPKSTYTGSTGLFKAINDSVSQYNTFATLAHPNPTDFNNIEGTAYNASADSAIVGSAIESGPAFSTNTSYTDPSTFNADKYLNYFESMLSKGYHLGPTIDHDNHNTTFGHTTRSRTAIVSPDLTKASIISAMRNMHFYATQDCDTKVDFTINTRILGSILTDRYGPGISVNLTDATTSTSSAVIRVMFGVPGSNTLAVKIDSAIGSRLVFNDASLPNLATGYYYIDITNGMSHIVTSPIWYTRDDAAAALPVKVSAFAVQKMETTVKITWTTEQESNSRNFVVEHSTDGRSWSAIATVNAAGNSSHRLDYLSYDNAPANGINYYRLKQVDKDGSFEYSVVRSVLFSKSYDVRITPNPATTFVNVYVAKSSMALTQIIVTDVSGKVIDKFNTADQTKQINTGNYARGVYFIKTITGGNINTQKIIIQ